MSVGNVRACSGSVSGCCKSHVLVQVEMRKLLSVRRDLARSFSNVSEACRTTDWATKRVMLRLIRCVLNEHAVCGKWQCKSSCVCLPLYSVPGD